MPERAYLSIGEVLALLRDEFTDITISKIRFLESQGLIDPERTPSGYRKFYEQDVERLRWILRQQKEHYLPLRVIKGKLSEAPNAEESQAEVPPVLAAVPDPPEEVTESNGARSGGARSSGAALQPVPTAAPAALDRPTDGRRAAPPFPESLRRSTRTSPAAFLTAPEQPRHLRPASSLTSPAASPLAGGGEDDRSRLPRDGYDQQPLR